MATNEEIEFALNEHRLLVLLEDEDNKFYQIQLNAEQFKTVSDACIAHKEKSSKEGMRDGMEMVYMHIDGDWSLDSDLFLGCSSIASPDQFIENCEECRQ